MSRGNPKVQNTIYEHVGWPTVPTFGLPQDDGE